MLSPDHIFHFPPYSPLSLSLSLFLQSIQETYDSLIHRDIKLRFLQVLAPGQIYPQRKHVSTTPVATSPTVDGPTSLVDGAGMQKKFRMEDVGLAWTTVDTLHYFMYPGDLYVIVFVSV